MKGNSICLAIDYQERLMPAIDQGEAVITQSEKFLQGLSILEIPVIVTQQYTKGLGMTLPGLMQAAGTKSFFDKVHFSCMKDENIKKAVEERRPKRVFLCGVEAHICVLQTALDLKSQGYEVVLVADCIGSRHSYDKEMAILRATQEGFVVTTYEAILYQLLEKAGGQKFKEISAIVK